MRVFFIIEDIKISDYKMNHYFYDIIYALSNLYDIMSIKIKKLKVKKEICQKNAYIYNRRAIL